MRAPRCGLRAFGALVLVLVVAPPAAALDPTRRITDYQIDHWGPADGVPQASVQELAQGEDGYLWLATQEGVARFDGVQFEVFDSRTCTAFDSNHITSMVTHGGSVWFTPVNEGVGRITDGDVTMFTVDDGLRTDWAHVCLVKPEPPDIPTVPLS